jgi:hypothetical protein
MNDWASVFHRLTKRKDGGVDLWSRMTFNAQECRGPSSADDEKL